MKNLSFTIFWRLNLETPSKCAQYRKLTLVTQVNHPDGCCWQALFSLVLFYNTTLILFYIAFNLFHFQFSREGNSFLLALTLSLIPFARLRSRRGKEPNSDGSERAVRSLREGETDSGRQELEPVGQKEDEHTWKESQSAVERTSYYVSSPNARKLFARTYHLKRVFV